MNKKTIIITAVAVVLALAGVFGALRLGQNNAGETQTDSSSEKKVEQATGAVTSQTEEETAAGAEETEEEPAETDEPEQEVPGEEPEEPLEESGEKVRPMRAYSKRRKS